MLSINKPKPLISTYNLPLSLDNQPDNTGDSDGTDSDSDVTIVLGTGRSQITHGHSEYRKTASKWPSSNCQASGPTLRGAHSCRTTSGYIRDIQSPEIYPQKILYMSRRGAVSADITKRQTYVDSHKQPRRDSISTPYSQQTRSDLLSAIHKAWFRSQSDLAERKRTNRLQHTPVARPASIAGELASRPMEEKTREPRSTRCRFVNFKDQVDGTSTQNEEGFEQTIPLDRALTDTDIVAFRLRMLCAERRSRSSLTAEDIRARKLRRFTYNRKKEVDVAPVVSDRPSKLFRKFRMIAILTSVMVKLLWVIIGISETKSVRTATELQWQTLYSTKRSSRKLAFDKTLYTRERATTKMPQWAIRILEIPPYLRDEQKSRQIHTLLRGMRSFDKFTEDIQFSLCRACTYQCVTEGRVILRKGHIGYNFYIVYSGSAFVNVDDVNSAGETFVKTEAVVKKGDSFGELALLQDVKRTATVAARETIELLVINKDIFAEVCPKIFETELGEKECFLRRLPIFSQKWWSKEALRNLCIEAQIQEYSINKLIVKDSRKDPWLYVCMEGKAQIIRCLALEDRQKEIKKLMRKRQSAIFLSEDLLELVRNLTPKLKDRGSNSTGDIWREQDKNEKEKLLESMSLEYVETGKRKETFIEELEENERKKELEYILGPKTLSSLMASEIERGKKDVVYLNIGTLYPDDIFDINSILNEERKPNSYHLLVSYGARILKIKKSDLFRYASVEAIEHGKNITSKNSYPSDSVLLQSYCEKATWDDYKTDLTSNILKPHLHIKQKFPQGHLKQSAARKTEEHRKKKLMSALKENEKKAKKEERDTKEFEADLDRRQTAALVDLALSQEAKYPGNNVRFHEPIMIRRKTNEDYIKRMDTLDVNIRPDKKIVRKSSPQSTSRTSSDVKESRAWRKVSIVI